MLGPDLKYPECSLSVSDNSPRISYSSPIDIKSTRRYEPMPRAILSRIIAPPLVVNRFVPVRKRPNSVVWFLNSDASLKPLWACHLFTSKFSAQFNSSSFVSWCLIFLFSMLANRAIDLALSSLHHGLRCQSGDENATSHTPSHTPRPSRMQYDVNRISFMVMLVTELLINSQAAADSLTIYMHVLRCVDSKIF